MSDLTQLPDPANECVKVFAECSRMALDPVREVIDRFREMNVTITFAMIIRGLNRYARRTPGNPGTLCWGLACYLEPMEGTEVARLFDRAVKNGSDPMDLLEAMLGCAQETGQDDGSARRHEVAA